MANVDANTDNPYSNFVTVALYCSVSMVTGQPSCVDRQRSAALGTLEGEKASVTAFTVSSQINISLGDNAKNHIIPTFSKLAIVRKRKHVLRERLIKHHISFVYCKRNPRQSDDLSAYCYGNRFFFISFS